MPIGPRFSNGVLQTLLVLMKKQPPKVRPIYLILICVCSRIDAFLFLPRRTNAVFWTKWTCPTRLMPRFASQISLIWPPSSKLSRYDCLLHETIFLTLPHQHLTLFTEIEHNRAFERLSQSEFEDQLSIGVKKLMMIIETARQDVDKVDKFVASIQDECSRHALSHLSAIPRSS